MRIRMVYLPSRKHWTFTLDTSQPTFVDLRSLRTTTNEQIKRALNGLRKFIIVKRKRQYWCSFKNVIEIHSILAQTTVRWAGMVKQAT